jgi:hypothetical protein
LHTPELESERTVAYAIIVGISNRDLEALNLNCEPVLTIQVFTQRH